jgi:predicted metalloprotease with PDZ domain
VIKKQLAILGFSMLFSACGSAKIRSNNDLAINNPIQSIIDLTSVTNDKAPVTIDPGRFIENEVIYRLPRVVQGSYEVSDFGNYIEDFVALDYNGKVLPSIKIDANSWTISNAKQLDKITYWVNDTYDIERDNNPSPIFSPEGTNISPDNYVLNLHGYIGYFDSLKNNSYTLDVIAPADFKRTSALETINTVFTNDNKVITSYVAPRYFDITDNPMMYGYLDVEEFMVDDINVVLSVYSPNKVHTATEIKETVYNMMAAQKAYLGDIHTTNRYDIILFLSDGKEDSPKGFGALEHQKSTVTVLREWSSKEYLAKSVIDVVAHEFFHIVTPLGIHSEDVHYFDYNNPTFSKHLWMYEGVTEYFAQHFQVYEGLMTEDEFYLEMSRKINISKRFDDTMSFTEMSENIIEEPYAENFNNVYYKGALIGMCLDILIQEESHGARSLVSLMKELSLKYGKDKPFVDNSIMDEITEMTYPSVGLFLKNYVEGNSPIPYDEIFDKVGLTISKYNIIKANENASDAKVALRTKWLHIKSHLD